MAQRFGRVGAPRCARRAIGARPHQRAVHRRDEHDHRDDHTGCHRGDEAERDRDDAHEQHDTEPPARLRCRMSGDRLAHDHARPAIGEPRRDDHHDARERGQRQHAEERARDQRRAEQHRRAEQRTAPRAPARAHHRDRHHGRVRDRDAAERTGRDVREALAAPARDSNRVAPPSRSRRPPPRAAYRARPRWRARPRRSAPGRRAPAARRARSRRLPSAGSTCRESRRRHRPA